MGLTRTAIVLAGHGSHITADTAGLIWARVDALRALGIADEVTAAFWKEAPNFHDVFRALTATDITVVPLFTAQGYFTQTVIPTEMGLTGALTERDGLTIRYTRTLSEHPYLGQMVRARVDEALTLLDVPRDQVAIAIIGHSTRRNTESRLATEAQAATIRAAGLVAEVVAVYLDDSPGIEDVYTLTSAPNLIAVPYFLTLGSHTTIDVPARLGLLPLVVRTERGLGGEVNGRQVLYTAPVGIDDSLTEVIIELAREAGAPFAAPYRVKSSGGFPMRGWAALQIAIDTPAGTVRFGDLDGRFLLAYRADDPSPTKGIYSMADLRRQVRESPFRPLSTARDLPGGWRKATYSPAEVHAVVETIYPGAVADWAANRAGTLAVETLEATLARQTGMYQAVRNLSAERRADLVKSVCGGCVRHPTWHVRHTPPDDIPCPAPCNWWLSRALDDAKDQGEAE